MQELQAADPLTEFFDAIRSPSTKQRYTARLAEFLDFANAKGDNLSQKARYFTDMARKDFDRTTYTINSFLHEQKARAESGEISAATIKNYVKPIKLFCEMNDIPINWKKIGRKLPTGREYAADRAPTREEIKTLLAYPDRRIRPCLLVMISSGIRIGAWETLTWGDLEPLKQKGQVIAAKLRVYHGDREEYSTFISGEAYRAVEEYVRYRESQGEKVGANSPILRDLFHPDRGGKGEPHKPNRLAANGVKRLLEDALKATGLRQKLPQGKRRHEWQGAHGFRKFFKSACERNMKTLHVEILLGHDTGLNENYYRPSEKELLEEYLKATPDLTMSEAVQAPVSEDVQDMKKKMAAQEERIKVLEELAKDNAVDWKKVPGLADAIAEQVTKEVMAKLRKEGKLKD